MANKPLLFSSTPYSVRSIAVNSDDRSFNKVLRDVLREYYYIQCYFQHSYIHHNKTKMHLQAATLLISLCKMMFYTDRPTWK